MLLPRLITAIVGIPLVLFSVYWGGIPFFILMLGVIFLALREYFVLVEEGKYGAQPVIGTITGVLLYISVFLNSTSMGPLAENQGTSAFLSLLLIPVFAREMLRKEPHRAIERLAVTFFGAFLVPYPWAFGIDPCPASGGHVVHILCFYSYMVY